LKIIIFGLIVSLTPFCKAGITCDQTTKSTGVRMLRNNIVAFKHATFIWTEQRYNFLNYHYLRKN